MLFRSPDHVFKGTVSNIGAILDPSIRMFVKATFRGQKTEMHTIVPASAVLHLHDRDFVFIPADDKKFRRIEVAER